jgi:predicted MPP superfamily phosphohydrolase
MKKQLLIAIGIILGIMTVMNVVMYQAFLSFSFFRVHSVLFSSILAVLSGNLILAMIISRKGSSRLMRFYYDASMMWMGIFGYVFLASIAYLLIELIAGRTLPFVALVLGGVVVIAVIYARMHAQHLVTKYVPVTLPNLPVAWRGRKAILISDVHIGLNQDRAFIHELVKKMNGLRPDIVFITGDLFDGSELSDILASAEPLKDIASTFGTYFISGNHEEYGDVPAFLETVKKAGMQALDENVIVIEGLQLVGASFSENTNIVAFKERLTNLTLDAKLPSILLKHEPRHLSVVEEKGISLQISGHTHHGQIWPIGYLTRLVYKRFTYGLQRFGKLQVYTSSGAGTWGPRMRIGSNSEVVVFEFR